MMSPNVNHDLGGRLLRMVTAEWAPFVIRHQSGTNTWYTGLCIDVLHILSDALNFTYTITEPSDGSYGRKLSNGTWIGMTGLLHNREVDFALAAMSVTEERATVSDYTTGFYFDEVAMITAYPQPSSRTLTFFFRPFHWLVFVLLGCALVLVAFLVVLMNRSASDSNFSLDPNVIKGKRNKTFYNICETGQAVFGTLLGRAVAYEDGSKPSTTLLYFWSLFSVVIVATYTGKLTSNSLLIQQPVPFTSLRELLQRTDYRWGLFKGGRIEAMFSNSTNEEYQRYYEAVQKFSAEDPNVLTSDLYVILKSILAGQYVHVTMASVYHFLKSDHCQLALVHDRLFQDTLAVHLQKGSPYTTLFNHVLTKAMEMGLLQYLTQKWFPENTSCDGDHATMVSVSLELVQTAFFMAAAGLVFATLCLGLERLITKH